MFKETIKELGNVKVGKVVLVDFPYENIKEIVNMTSSCGCGIAHNIATKSKVVVEYTPKDIPEHLRAQGSYVTTKEVVVNYITKQGIAESVRLLFTATIHA